LLGASPIVSQPHREFASAFNLQIDRAPLSVDSIALTPPIANPPTYFAVPHGQQMMVGTVHVAPNEPDVPTDSAVAAFLGELNLAVPGFECTSEDVVRVFAGRMPPAALGSHLPSKSPKIEHHARTGGPAGLTSVQGVKYTTARFIAERTLREVFSSMNKPLPGYSEISRPSPGSRPFLCSNDLPMVHDLQTWMTDESVVHIDDLMLRRCDLTLKPNEHLVLGKQLMELAKWDSSSWHDELARL
jgi:glycerol-3-phosphate dehydrogenase